MFKMPAIRESVRDTTRANASSFRLNQRVTIVVYPTKMKIFLPIRLSPPSPKIVRPSSAIQNTPSIRRALNEKTIYPDKITSIKSTMAGLILNSSYRTPILSMNTPPKKGSKILGKLVTEENRANWVPSISNLRRKLVRNV